MGYTVEDAGAAPGNPAETTGFVGVIVLDFRPFSARHSMDIGIQLVSFCTSEPTAIQS
jgi:hypothetical protein